MTDTDALTAEIIRLAKTHRLKDIAHMLGVGDDLVRKRYRASFTTKAAWNADKEARRTLRRRLEARAAADAEKREPAPLELAEGHLAVDARSYEILRQCST